MDKIRVLCFTDTHYTAKAPVSRKDGQEYLNNLLLKTKEIFEIGKEKNVDFFIHAGDFFESPDISNSVANQVGKVYMEAPAPVYVVAGNHDLIGNSYNSLFQTKLGMLITFDILKLIDSYSPLVFEKNGKTLKVTAAQSDFGVDANRDNFVSVDKDTDFLMHIIHAMLLRHKPNFGAYVPLNDIVELTQADVTFSGHYHLGFDTFINVSELTGKKKIFSNPGAIARKSALYEEINRPVKVNLFTFDCNTMEVDIEEIELTSAIKGEEVIDRSLLEEEKIYQEKIVNFKLALSDREFAVNVDTIDVLKAIAKEKEVPNEVLEDAIQRIYMARELLQKGESLDN